MVGDSPPDTARVPAGDVKHTLDCWSWSKEQAVIVPGEWAAIREV